MADEGEDGLRHASIVSLAMRPQLAVGYVDVATAASLGRPSPSWRESPTGGLRAGGLDVGDESHHGTRFPALPAPDRLDREVQSTACRLQ